MKRSRIFVVLFAIIIACFTAMPVFAEAEPEVIKASCAYKNPLYKDFVFQKTLLATVGNDTVVYCDTISESAAVLQSGMESRNGTIRVGYASTRGYTDDFVYQIFQEATKHTGVPTQGDYLLWHFGSYNANISYYTEKGITYISITYNIQYLSDAQMEQKMDAAVDALLLELDVENEPDYEKVCAVYNYICENVTYDYAGLAAGSSTAYTAYGALVNKTSVCQGYASLFYRLMLELDVDTRLIPGVGDGVNHGWNIVELSGLYYNVDSTWDANYFEARLDYQYFLKCDKNFGDHQRNSEYASTAFYSEYPMSVKDYTPESNLTFGLNSDGKSYYVYDCKDSTAGELMIPAIHNEKPVTGIGNLAFDNCSSLTSVSIPDSVTSIEDGAFYKCSSLTDIYYSGTKSQWNAIYIGSNNSNLTNIKIHYHSVSAIDSAGNEYYSLEDALSAVKMGDTISLMSDVTAEDLILPFCVSIDLNGYTLTVDSILTYSSNAIVDSSETVSGLLIINNVDGNMLSDDNVQLPVYDHASGGYRFFAINVISHAVTRINTNAPKVWFKIQAENFEQLYDLISAGSEMSIKLKMTWDGQTEETYAVADLAFTKLWADSYCANQNVYVTVTMDGLEGITNVVVTPCIGAYGVEIQSSESIAIPDRQVNEPETPSNYPYNVTYKEYLEMSEDEQLAFYKSFASHNEFKAWREAAKKAYDDSKIEIEMGPDGTIDLGGLIGGKQ